MGSRDGGRGARSHRGGRRDPTRFAELHEAHFRRVYANAVRRVRNRQEAEDLTAEVFHQALANPPGAMEWLIDWTGKRPARG